MGLWLGRVDGCLRRRAKLSKAVFSELNKVSKNVTRTHRRVTEKKGLIEDFSQEKVVLEFGSCAPISNLKAEL